MGHGAPIDFSAENQRPSQPSHPQSQRWSRHQSPQRQARTYRRQSKRRTLPMILIPWDEYQQSNHIPMGQIVQVQVAHIPPPDNQQDDHVTQEDLDEYQRLNSRPKPRRQAQQRPDPAPAVDILAIQDVLERELGPMGVETTVHHHECCNENPPHSYADCPMRRELLES